MASRSTESNAHASDQRRRAGASAERQMAFYLHRAFGASEAVVVLNDLRLIDPSQPEHDGRAGVCQIDHLVLHRFGAIIVESKSVFDEVSVRGDGAGGDEWTRRYQGREQGFASPIQQARRQGVFLRAYLHQHRASLLGKVSKGLRTMTKLLSGTDHRGFSLMPIQVVVAISDGGKIRRVGGWTPPSDPFRTFVSKADLAADKAHDEIKKHEAASRLLSKTDGEYGVWAMKPEEVGEVATFLRANHQPQPDAPVAVSAPVPSA
ncbi:MAG: nuclease-related domain-containing protein, partial [Planctomycetota bacterium]